MLNFSRGDGDSFRIGDNIVVYVIETKKGRVTLGIEAPREVPIVRSELCDGLFGWPRVWKLFSLCLPAKVREQTFDPSFSVFVRDYLQQRKRNRSRWARRWLHIAWTIRTVAMVAECARAASWDRAAFALWQVWRLIK